MPRAWARGILRLVVVALLSAEYATIPPQPDDAACGAEEVVNGRFGARQKTAAELRVEGIIEEAYRRCFRTFIIDGHPYELRLPFGETGERTAADGFSQLIFEWGKGDPARVWARAGELISSEDFRSYATALRMPGAKVVVFDLESATWAVFTDREVVDSLRAGPYPGTRTIVYIRKDGDLQDGDGFSKIDIYNYLYCVGSLGMDCSGFVSFIQRCIAAAADPGKPLDLGYSGLWYFTPGSGRSEIVDDRIVNLRPGDILIFFGHEGTFRHSAVIQSVDLDAGIVRYLQNTDWAPQEQRGVHESFIRFSPANPGVRLGDPSVRWEQRIMPTFPDEPGLRYWRSDGDRYRTVWPRGRSLVVRLLELKRALIDLEADYYVNLTPTLFRRGLIE